VNRRVLSWLGGLAAVCLVCATPAQGGVAYPDTFARLGGLDLAPRGTGPGALSCPGGGLVQQGLAVSLEWRPGSGGTEGGIDVAPSGGPIAPGLGPTGGRGGLGSGPAFATVEDLRLATDVPQPLVIFVWTVLGLFVSLGVAQHRRVRTLRNRLPWSTEQREAILKIVDRDRPAAGDEEWREVDSPW